MKKLLTFLLISSLRQRVYHFREAMDAYAFAVEFDGAVEIKETYYQVTI
jgi:hypothetical protein